MVHHIPASPGPRVAGNQTIARVRGVRVLDCTGLIPRPMLDDVNFDLRRGERLGVSGGEASGTSAIARALSGQARTGEAVTGGTVEIGGTAHRLTDGDVEGVRRQVKLVTSTEPAGSTDAVNRERKAILLALAEQPAVVVIDQTSDLPRDSEDETNAAFLTRAFGSTDAALVLVTEDPDVLRQTCDTVQILLAGRIVERGPAAEVLANPHHRYAQTLVTGVRWTPTPGRVARGCAFESDCVVGHGRRDCSTTFPESRSFPSRFGSVTTKCHQPAGVHVGTAHSDHENEEENR